TATGGTPATTKYAFFGRRVGTTAWTPDVTTPNWQTSNVMNWTPTSTDTGTWEIVVWVKDGDTPASPGYAATCNPGTVQIMAPLTVTGTGSPAYSPYATTITWPANPTSGVAATPRYAFVRPLPSTTPS